MKVMSLLSVLVVVGSSLRLNLPYVRCLLSFAIVVGSSVLMNIFTLLFALIARSFSSHVDAKRKLIVRPSVAIAVTGPSKSVLIRAYAVRSAGPLPIPVRLARPLVIRFAFMISVSPLPPFLFP